MTELPDHYINKNVRFKFMGEECSFALSHGLFSSFDIDQGSKLLLKTVAQQAPVDEVDAVLDVGCGTGTLGICLKRRRPTASLVMQDRDALAVAVSALNCRRNGIGLSDAAVRNELALEGLGERSFDLILSNIPAKAGTPVIEDLLLRAPSFLTERGRAAIVVVTPLESLVERTLVNNGMVLLHRERTANHAVFHYRGPGQGRTERFSVYLRKTASFTLETLSYTLDTAYNIPDFDQLGFAVRNTGSVLKGHRFSGRFLFLNPGQGHIPACVIGRAGRIERTVLAGTDLLALRTSAHNIGKGGTAGEPEIFPAAGPYALQESGERGSFSFLWADLQPVPGSVPQWLEELAGAADFLLGKGGFLAVSGKSSDVFQFVRGISGFVPTADRKFRGFRSLLLQKRI